MSELKIHSEGEKDHLKALMEKYSKLKSAIKRNSKLSEEEKQTELKAISEDLKKEIKDSNHKLY